MLLNLKIVVIGYVNRLEKYITKLSENCKNLERLEFKKYYLL